MPTLVQINATANSGSTGKIAEQINKKAREYGWNTYLAYGRRMQPCESELIQVGNRLQVYEHYLEHRLFDNDGKASRIATRKLIHKLRTIKPDIIHLHNIHDHWLNYRILFEFLRSAHIPVVWTQHDCWSFTGRCSHFSQMACYKWRDGGCKNNCPALNLLRFRPIGEKTFQHYCEKNELFTQVDDLTIVTVSNWLEGLVRQSFLNKHKIITIHNGVDVSLFQPMDSTKVRRKYGLEGVAYVIGVSSVWLPYKGWYDFLELARMLPESIRLVMVGLNSHQLAEVSSLGIKGIPHTDNIRELAELYSGAILTLNLSSQESFGLTTVEGFACGTPGVVYNTTASPELISDNYSGIPSPDSSVYAGSSGWVVRQGDIRMINEVINLWYELIKSDPCSEHKIREICRSRAMKEFNKDDKFLSYIELYDRILES